LGIYKDNLIYVYFVVYKATGGLAHSLGGLWRAIQIARGSNRSLVIDYNVHKDYFLLH